ncbi:hypothetical protein Bcep1808_5518 [Burkholderia vietnamiensis G4]|uniref:Uncharacterized protein n=1 Tax=Burkholderia vietnamiensis (strain G4 / LMG 22486) TaxID=269482 RepID=A4JQA9_BURVG|nr:hypothetical protein Bcep1808_5518 [Burkholderia vietnamiensis G4]
MRTNRRRCCACILEGQLRICRRACPRLAERLVELLTIDADANKPGLSADRADTQEQSPPIRQEIPLSGRPCGFDLPDRQCTHDRPPLISSSVGSCIPMQSLPDTTNTKKLRLARDFRGSGRTTNTLQTLVRRGFDGFHRT